MNDQTRAFRRQKLQIQSLKETTTAKELIDKDSLKSKMDEWKFPYHFIDFETCQVALPFHKNQKPFTMLATQYSCHSLNEDGTIDHSEWIAKQDNHDPSFECIEKLLYRTRITVLVQQHLLLMVHIFFHQNQLLFKDLMITENTYHDLTLSE